MKEGDVKEGEGDVNEGNVKEGDVKKGNVKEGDGRWALPCSYTSLLMIFFLCFIYILQPFILKHNKMTHSFYFKRKKSQSTF